MRSEVGRHDTVLRGVSAKVDPALQDIDIARGDVGVTPGDVVFGGDVFVAHDDQRETRDRVIGVGETVIRPGLANPATELLVANTGTTKGAGCDILESLGAEVSRSNLRQSTTE
jgi:hypothetical protein